MHNQSSDSLHFSALASSFSRLALTPSSTFREGKNSRSVRSSVSESAAWALVVARHFARSLSELLLDGTQMIPVTKTSDKMVTRDCMQKSDQTP